MNDELAKLDSLRHQGILDEGAYWDARSRLLNGPAPYAGPPVAPDPQTPPAAQATEAAPWQPRSARHHGPRRRRGRLVAALAAAVVVLAGAGVGAYFLWIRDTSVTVQATFVLEDAATAEAQCTGQGENSVIAAGSEVRLVDGDENEVGRAKLPAGTHQNGTCTFRVTMTAIPDGRSAYTLTTPGFSRTTMTRAELSSAGWAFTVRKDPPSGAISGTLVLSDLETALNGCTGTGGYDDIHEDAAVVIRDQDGRILGSGHLFAGTSDGYQCTYEFALPDIRHDQAQYTVEVSHRGEITASRAELSAHEWQFALTLGD